MRFRDHHDRVLEEQPPINAEGTPYPARTPVLLADDDSEMRWLIARALRGKGYEVLEAADGVELLNLIATELDEGPVRRPALVISDIRMPGASGMQVLAELREHNQSIPVVLTTAFGDPQTHAEAERLGAEIVFDKPFDIGDLCTVVRILIGS